MRRCTAWPCAWPGKHPTIWSTPVEESVLMAQRISRLMGTPYVYDMDSSMSHQIADHELYDGLAAA